MPSVQDAVEKLLELSDQGSFLLLWAEPGNNPGVCGNPEPEKITYWSHFLSVLVDKAVKEVAEKSLKAVKK